MKEVSKISKLKYQLFNEIFKYFYMKNKERFVDYFEKPQNQEKICFFKKKKAIEKKIKKLTKTNKF